MGFSAQRNGILLPKLFRPAVRKKYSSDWEKLLRFEAVGQEFAKFLRSQEQSIQKVKGQYNFLETECFFKNFPGGFSHLKP